MRKIIPLIVLMTLFTLFTKAQNISQADDNLALQLVSANKAAIGISADLLSNAKLIFTTEDKTTGIRYVSLQQSYKGILVHNQVLSLTFRNGKLLSHFGYFDPSIEKLVNVSSATPSVTAESAVQSALSDRGFRPSTMAIAVNKKDDGKFVEFNNMGISRENITAQLAWIPNEVTKIYSLAWKVYIIPKTTSDYWMVRVNAVDNSILGMDNYTDYDNWGTPFENPNIKYPGFLYGTTVANSPFDFKKINEDPSTITTASYRVVPIPAEAPSFPGGTPALRTDPWLNATVANAVTLKWNTGASATDYNYTRGNNVWAYQDRANTNSGSIATSASSTTALPSLTFNFIPDFTVTPIQSTPVQNEQFNITNLFYWNNLFHDITYAYGFTEANKNFQDDNLGRGGVGNDHVNAEAQDGSGTNNANFSTPADGSSGRMQMYLWTGSPQLDGDADAGVICHEHGHGLSNRLNPGGVGCLGNTEQAGEGWSDYMSLMLTQNWATSTLSSGFNAPRGIGTYVLGQPPTGLGIRPAKYCTDFTVNNYTYANLPAAVVPHGVGFIFCTALWEMTWEIINDPSSTGIEPNIYNWNSTGGNVVALRLVMEGLRTQQCQPGFISARNAIMTADTTLYGGAHACAILRAFARRGMGVGASEGSTNNNNDQTVSFNGGGPAMTFTQNGAAGIPELGNIIYNHAITANCSAMVNFTLRDTLPLNVTFVSATNGGTYAGGTRVASWPVNIAVGATQNYGLTVQINAGSYFPPVVLINEPVASTTISGFWTTASTTGNVWIAHNVRSHSAPNSFFTPDAAAVSDQTIATTANFAIGATPPVLSFWHWYNSESTFDGGVLEISTNGGTTWSDIGAANITQNGYNGTISASFGNPLAGRAAWTGNSTAFVETKVNLTPYANQATVKLRWRFGSDNSVASTGWNVDDIVAQTIAVVNMRSSLFNASNVRVNFFDTVTVILPGAAVPPSVTINQAAAQPDPTSVSPIHFTIVFSEPVTGFTAAGINLAGTAGATTKVLTGSGATYDVAVSGMTANGTVIATVAANAATGTINVLGNTASTSTDNTVTFSLVPPPCVTLNGTITAADPSTSLRSFRDAVIATCAVPKSCTAGIGGTFQYKILSWTNPSASAQCVTVTHSTTSANFGFVSAYNGAVNLANLCTNWVADGGSSATPALPTTFSFTAPGNATISFLVTNVTNGQTIDYSIAISAPICTSCPVITVNPIANDTVCAGSTAGGYNFASTPAGATFSWTNSNTAIGLGASGAGNIAAFTATNATTAPITGNITVTPTISTPITVTSSLTAADGALTNRIFRDAVASTCAVPKAYPGTFATAGTYYYKTYTYTNTSASAQCVTVNYSSTTASQVHVIAYNGSFNPASQATNYLADGGTSATTGAPVTFSFTAPGSATIVFVVVEPIDLEINPSFTMTINGLTICTGTPRTFSVTVYPTSTVNAIPNQVVCRGQATAAVNFTGTVPNTIFNWANNNTSIGLAASGSGNIASFIAQNPTGVPQVATITVTPVYSPGGPATPVVTTFNSTGAVQTFVVPAGITSVNIKAWGAQGNSNALGVVGGLGGYAEGTLAVAPGQTLYVNAGGGATTSINGGFNGGGAAGVNAGCASAQGGGGGGASDVRITANTLANRVLVAGGGGGAGANRVAGCGRGTGGGGGGGLWGGGGGAGWPGIPGSEGPVPTGGTQTAGGAGGVTTFSPGPTNGLPGVLGIGGAGGTEIGSNQGGSAVAESGGIGGGLTGGSGLYNNVNNWCGQSGAGGSSYIGGVTSGLTTSGLRSGNGQVQIIYTPIVGLSCPGTPRTFTITVNPNQDLIIVADPGTVLCEGDPTLLTVYNAGSASGPGTLYTQSGASTNGSPSQVFEPANAAFNSQGADDFTVPAATTWSITNVTTQGIGTGTPTSVNVFFYNNSGSNLPGTVVASYNNVSTFVQTGGNYNVTLPTPLNLGAGTYWVSFQVNMSFATGGQWFWGNFGGAANIGNQYAWQNPGGGFATPCTGWGYGATGCGVGGTDHNNIFSLVGSSVTVGTIATGTFLWSPAAGLSSTTSNPVAASPMNTTTYTVTRTTVPGGCVASAQITITVNKRPTVTTQPVSRTNCAGTTATFTVGGTGTGLTYQWQVSPTGVGGPWSNVPAAAPYTGTTGPTLTIAPVSTILNGYAYRCVLGGVCAAINNANISNAAVLTVNALPNISVTPPVSCGGVQGISGTLLTVTSSVPPVPGNVSVNSGAISVGIPDASGALASSNLIVAGVPANATITEIKVNMNINHTWVGDVDVNIKAPNAAILNLVGRLDGGAGGNATANFTNTTFSSIGVTPISGAPAPRTATFAAEARPLGPIGFVQTVTSWVGAGSLVPAATNANGTWTLGMGDFAGGDVGTLTNWSISIDYTTPGVGTPPPLTYVWSPLAGLFTDPISTIAYTGTNTATVYASPTVQTVYTVTATNGATGCTNTATALVNYTPPPPTVTPNPVVMCLGDPAVLLKSSSSTAGVCTTSSGAISVPVPDGSAAGAISTLNVSCVPAGATITGISVNFNMPAHTYVGDMTFNLKAPNGTVLNLIKNMTGTGTQAGAYPNSGFVNTTISSTGSAVLGTASTTPITGTWKADLINGVVTPGYTISDPTGYVSTATAWSQLYSTPTGVWTLAMADDGAGDVGTLTSWSITINYVVGVVASPAVWTPAGGLFSDAGATVPYVAGTGVDSVWTRPTPSGVYNYDVTVRNVIATTSTITTPLAGGNGNNLVAFNVRNNNAIPVTFTSISSNTFGSGAVTSRVFFKPGAIAGNPGAISAANGWNQFGTANTNVTAGTNNLLISGMTLQIQPGQTIGIALDMTGATFPAYTNGTGTVITYSNGGCDLITDGNVGWGGPNAPGTPANNPRNFNGSVTLVGSGPGTCVSPARRVVVTVNDLAVLNSNLPAAQIICTDKVATFSVATTGGTGPFTYQWQVSTNGNNPPWTNITNGGVYSGATTATLTITAPPVTMNGNFYRCLVTSAAPCAAVASIGARLTVNPLPVIVISNSPTYRSLFPGLTTTLSAVVTPNAAVTYTWLRDGVPYGTGGTNPTLVVDVDHLGTYSLRVTDVNGCTNTNAASNNITIKDSVNGKCFIYPNPTSGKFEVRYYSTSTTVTPRSLTIFDAKGERVFTQFYSIGRPYERMPVDMRAYGKGLYWVEIGDVNGNRITMCRVVIQ